MTVSAKVNQIVSPDSFTVGGLDDTESVEPLLIVWQRGVGELTEGLPVEVTGVVKEAADLPTVLDQMGLDLEDGALVDYNGTNYLQATSIDTTVTVDD